MEIDYTHWHEEERHRTRPVLVSIFRSREQLRAEGAVNGHFVEESVALAQDDVAAHLLNRWIEKTARVLALDGHDCSQARATRLQVRKSAGSLQAFAVDFSQKPREQRLHVVIGATEPSGGTLDWLDDTACLTFAQGARRQKFIKEEVRPHDDTPRYYFVRTLRLPASTEGNGEPRRRQQSKR